MEFDAAAASTALFEGAVMPTSLAVADFSADSLQRRLPNQPRNPALLRGLR